MPAGDGHVVCSKPLSYQGTLIDNIAVRFEEGRIVEAKASRGEEVLNKVLDTDEGARAARRSGAGAAFLADLEKRIVVLQHAVRRERRLPHRARPMLLECFIDGAKLTPQQIAAQGGNQSLIHIDWMIGSAETDIDGIHADGTPRPGVPQGRVGLTRSNGTLTARCDDVGSRCCEPAVRAPAGSRGWRDNIAGRCIRA